MARRRRPERQQPIADWNFRTFPVIFAFACGAFVATLLLLLTGGALVSVLWVISLFGVSFGVAHIIGHTIRKRSLDRAIAREEEDERERRALAARQAAALEGEERSRRRRRRRP
jgi:hypothetical protein